MLAYPRIETRWKLRTEEIEQYVQLLANASELVVPESQVPIVLKDADDDPILYTALTGKAHVLCTLDAHFYQESVQSFCSQKGIAIMDDAALLRMLRGQQE